MDAAQQCNQMTEPPPWRSPKTQILKGQGLWLSPAVPGWVEQLGWMWTSTASMGPKWLAYRWPMFLLWKIGIKNVDHIEVWEETRQSPPHWTMGRDTADRWYTGTVFSQVMRVLWKALLGESDEWTGWPRLLTVGWSLPSVLSRWYSVQVTVTLLHLREWSCISICACKLPKEATPTGGRERGDIFK